MRGGRGGSAAEAQHLVTELVGRYLSNRRSLPAVFLGGDAGMVSCLGHDFSFDDVFTRPLSSLGVPGDVVGALAGGAAAAATATAAATADGPVRIPLTLTERVFYRLGMPLQPRDHGCAVIGREADGGQWGDPCDRPPTVQPAGVAIDAGSVACRVLSPRDCHPVGGGDRAGAEHTPARS